MFQLAQWLDDSVPDIHPVIVAGIAHLRLVEIHPFSDGNGRTARALTALILQRGGYSFNRLLALDRHFDHAMVKYCEEIGDTVVDHFQSGRDLTNWLEYFAFVLEVEIKMASDAVIDLRRWMEGWQKFLSTKGYSERHTDILAYALINTSIRPRDVVRIAKVSSVTAGTDLKKLTEAGLLETEGYGRSKVYRPSEGLWERINLQ
jgi:Fic family protein